MTRGEWPRMVLLCNPEGRRAALLREAIAAAGGAPAAEVSWLDLLSGRTELDAVARGAFVRVDSPGRDVEVERLLLALGAEAGEDFPADVAYAGMSRAAALGAAFEKGEILFPRQWYRGFSRAMRRVETEAAKARSLLTPAEDVLTMYDKRACHAALQAAGVAVPRGLGPVRSHEELLAAMRGAEMSRVFVKLAHGSSASGVVAYQTRGGRHAATTTTEMVQTSGGVRLFNSRRVRTYTDPREVALLIDAVASHCVHVEEWVPKAGIGGKTFDLRVMVIAGRARHVVVRKSATPLTNLHLLNEREGPERVRARMGEANWAAAMAACERAAGVFSRSLQVAVDLMITPGFRGHAVAEVNAFGDLLPGAEHEGESTYAAEIAAMRRWCGAGPDASRGWARKAEVAA